MAARFIIKFLSASSKASQSSEVNKGIGEDGKNIFSTSLKNSIASSVLRFRSREKEVVLCHLFLKELYSPDFNSIISAVFGLSSKT